MPIIVCLHYVVQPACSALEMSPSSTCYEEVTFFQSELLLLSLATGIQVNDSAHAIMQGKHW